MRMSRIASRPIMPTSRDRRLGPLVLGRRAARAGLLAGLVIGLAVGVSGCGAGGGSESAIRPSTERSGTRPAPSVTESPSETTTAPTRPTRTSADTPTSTRTPTSAERPTSPTTAPVTSADALPPTSTPTPSAAGTPASAESEGLGPLGWTLLIVLVVGLIAGWLLWRSRRKSAGDAQAAALEADTRTTTTGTELPSVLTAETAGQRALSWPPLRAAMADLIHRWDLLAEHAPDDRRRTRSGQIRNLLQQLLAAVDAENQALAAERDWAAPAAAGRPGRTGAVRSARWRTATGATRRRGAGAATARPMATTNHLMASSEAMPKQTLRPQTLRPYLERAL
jgi:hypothetical protein